MVSLHIELNLILYKFLINFPQFVCYIDYNTFKAGDQTELGEGTEEKMEETIEMMREGTSVQVTEAHPVNMKVREREGNIKPGNNIIFIYTLLCCKLF